uniref:Secreted protein n=1 Tax=Ixodes ricinus TaxID=34613 RepID=A0A147BE73_IXORI
MNGCIHFFFLLSFYLHCDLLMLTKCVFCIVKETVAFQTCRHCLTHTFCRQGSLNYIYVSKHKQMGVADYNRPRSACMFAFPQLKCMLHIGVLRYSMFFVLFNRTIFLYFFT